MKNANMSLIIKITLIQILQSCQISTFNNMLEIEFVIFAL